MNKQFIILFSIVILLTFTVVTSIDVLPTADATKAKGTSTQKYGTATKSIVCGDRLCSEISSNPIEKQIEDKVKHGEDKVKHGEDMMKQKHLQMLEKMKSMTKMQMIDSMKSMMSEHHDMKIEKMTQMDVPELRKHIEKMLDKMSKDEYSDMDDVSHEDELTKFHTADLLSQQHLKTFDELDFDVFTNQKWDRLHESHSKDITVHWPDGRTTVGIEPHIEDLKAMFVWAPDTRIEQHPIKIASGQWTSVIGVMEGTFTEPMPLLDGTFIQPTGKSFKLIMATVGYWENGVMTEEYLFWDNMEFMKQIGLV